MRTLSLIALLCLATASQAQDAITRQTLPPQATLAFVNVNVIPMDAERVVAGQTVVVQAGRITAMGPASSTAVPAGAQRIDGNGRYLMPGLAEMHSHVPNPQSTVGHNVLFLYVANGVTTIRGMQGNNSHVALREQIARGEVLGPRFFAAGPQLGSAIRTPEAGRNAVQRQKELGFDLLKIQEGLPLEVYDTVAAVAKQLGIPFAGHIPNDVGLWHALESGQKTIDHLDNYMEAIEASDFPQEMLNLVPGTGASQARKVAAAAAATKRAGVAVVPTMALWEILQLSADSASVAGRAELPYMPSFTIDGWFSTLRGGPRVPRERHADWIALRRSILKALSDAGVPILLGTDSPQLFSVPGYSIHREMTAMREAGMTAYQILRSGTWDVAEHLDLLSESGSVAVGKRADLILLEANPLVDVANVALRSGVVVAGRWLAEAEIQERLARIAASYRQ